MTKRRRIEPEPLNEDAYLIERLALEMKYHGVSAVELLEQLKVVADELRQLSPEELQRREAAVTARAGLT